MARPVNADPARTRARLLAAAARHFSRSGVQGTSLRAVARSADVSLATINHYFGTKQDLYDACRDHAFADLSRELAPLAQLLDRFAREMRDADASADPPAVIDALVREGFRFGRRQQSLLRLVMRPVIETGELEEPWRERSFVPFLTAASALLAGPLGRPVIELRMALQAIIALGVRYCLSTPRELAWLAGTAAPGAEPTRREQATAIALFEDHLVRAAHRLLLGGDLR